MATNKYSKERGEAFENQLRSIGAYDCAFLSAAHGSRSAPVVIAMQVWATPEVWEQWLTFLELRRGKTPEAMIERMKADVSAKAAYYSLCREQGLLSDQATLLAAHYVDPVFGYQHGS